MVKPFKNFLLKNQKANDLGTWYVALGLWGLPSSNDDPRLTLTYLTSRSICFLMHLNGKISENLIFFKTVEALVIILT